MKTLLCFVCMTFGVACGATAKGGDKPTESKATTTVETKKSLVVEQRAGNLTDQMIRELRLNNYQSSKLRTINMDVVAKMQAIEDEFAGNQQLIEEKCKEVCAERD